MNKKTKNNCEFSVWKWPFSISFPKDTLYLSLFFGYVLSVVLFVCLTLLTNVTIQHKHLCSRKWITIYSAKGPFMRSSGPMVWYADANTTWNTRKYDGLTLLIKLMYEHEEQRAGQRNYAYFITQNRSLCTQLGTRKAFFLCVSVFGNCWMCCYYSAGKKTNLSASDNVCHPLLFSISCISRSYPWSQQYAQLIHPTLSPEEHK